MTCETRFFRCDICGNLVGMIHSSGAPMTCCGQHMTELDPRQRGREPGKARSRHQGGRRQMHRPCRQRRSPDA